MTSPPPMRSADKGNDPILSSAARMRLAGHRDPASGWPGLDSESRKIRGLAGARHVPGRQIGRARIVALSWDGLAVAAIDFHKHGSRIRAPLTLSRNGSAWAGKSGCPANDTASSGFRARHAYLDPMQLPKFERHDAPPRTHVDRDRRIPMTASSPRGTFSQAELTAEDDNPLYHPVSAGVPRWTWSHSWSTES